MLSVNWTSILKNIVDLPGRPGFNNSLDSGNYKQWWTPRDDLAAEQPEVSKLNIHILCARGD